MWSSARHRFRVFVGSRSWDRSTPRGSDRRSLASSLHIAETNIYIDAANDAAFLERFEGFVREHGALLVSTVVVAEVVLGISDASRRAEAVEALAHRYNL